MGASPQRWLPAAVFIALVGCVPPFISEDDGGTQVDGESHRPTARAAATDAGATVSDDARPFPEETVHPGVGLWCGFDPKCSSADNEGCAVACPDGLICNTNHRCAVPRYALSDAGTVTDEVTHLVWQQDVSDSQCSPTLHGWCSWAQANDYCQSLELGPYDWGWTLPTIEQLFSLVEHGQPQSIDARAFPGYVQPYWTWSSTGVEGFNDDAWWWVWWPFPGDSEWGYVGYFIGPQASAIVRCVHPVPEAAVVTGPACGFDPTCSPSDNSSCAFACPDGLTCNVNGQCSAPSYDVSEAGTVKDNVTGLIWQRDTPANQCPGNFDGFCRFSDGQRYCQTLKLGGYASGWRLPTVDELFSLVEKGKYLTLDSTAFTDASGEWYMSSETATGSYEAVWGVEFGGGGIHPYDSEAAPGNVRCVRR